MAGKEETEEEIMGRLRAAEQVLIATHEHPDGDAAGSALALAHALRLQGKRVTVYVPDPAPEYLNFLPGFDWLTSDKPEIKGYDTVILLDYTQLYRTHLEEEVRRHNNTICIDHHYDNKGETTLNLIVPAAAATAQIIAELFRENDVPVTRDIATCLLTGIFTDTGSFMHDSTTPDILVLASELMGKGARLAHIAHETYQKKDLPGLRIWGRALSRVIVNQETGAAVSVITHKDMEECGATLDDLSGVVNLLNTLPQTDYTMLLTEYEPGKIKGSLRSEPHKGVDVSLIAKRLGGGGHKLASGFEVNGKIVMKDGQWRIEK
ncbi:MAG: DHH family phosphoesterase [Candidatus Binatia bacterium]|nr:DHH family phosphoesterase [Candidatus Binatia bacterium]